MNWSSTLFHWSFWHCSLKRWPLLALCVLTCGLVIVGHLDRTAIASVLITPHPITSSFQQAQLHQAQSLNAQGQQALTQGQPEIALNYWQQAEAAYQSAADQQGVWGTQLNQAKALHTLGFYHRAHGQLSQLVAELSPQPTSLLKINAWLTYGRGMRLLGKLERALAYLEEGLALTQQLEDEPYQQTAHLYLGNALAAKQQWAAARSHYAQAATLDGSLQRTAQLRQLQTLPHLNREAEIPSEVQALVQQSLQETSVATRLHLTLDLAQWLLRYSPKTLWAIAPESALQTAIQQARNIGDTRAESYGWGYLGRWHEQQQQWAIATQETQKALSLAQTLDADELRYQWQWQQGRIAKAQGNRQQAISYYSSAVDSLQNLRQDMVAITRDVQFSFRDQIEPVYRDLVALLLPPALAEDAVSISGKRSVIKNRGDERAQKTLQASLEQARQTIEDLQLAELNNFFREPCLESVPQALDTLDPSAAVLYPIILPNRLAVILSIPGQPLRYYAQPLSQSLVKSGIQAMLNSMRPTSFSQERLDAAQQIYQWLIAPAEEILQTNGIQTLAFVLDDALRNLPIAALHNGEHYLVEDYQLSVSPGLQLLQINESKSLSTDLSVLVGGLSISKDRRPPLAGVKQEISYVDHLLDARVLLDEAFTNETLIDQTRQRSFDILHLATHAQFGATDAETFIETWDSTLQINQLRQLLTQQDSRGLPPSLLVLSACDTAQGNSQAILGMAGLAVRSGAQTTLATLWSVNDQATAIFIQHFYDGLVNLNLTKAGAIKYAQQQLIQRENFQHPFYWAPFVLIGDWL